jgi:hypothetical protein
LHPLADPITPALGVEQDAHRASQRDGTSADDQRPITHHVWTAQAIGEALLTGDATALTSPEVVAKSRVDNDAQEAHLKKLVAARKEKSEKDSLRNLRSDKRP